MTTQNGYTCPVFKDATLNELLHKQGYVIVPFLNPAEIEGLTKFFNSGEQEKIGQFMSFAVNDYAYRKAVHEQIEKAFSRSFQILADDFRPFWGNFFTKPAGSPAMPMHADLQYVKEPGNISLNIWCPLVDTNADNGAFGVVPYSHKLIKQIRGTNITDAYRKNAHEIQAKLGKLLELKAGEAIIYDHRLLHYSLPNLTQAGRLAATLIAVPKGADLVHYYAKNEGDTTIYKYSIASVADLLKTGFMKNPEHLQPVETIESYIPTPLAVEDFNGIG